MENWELLEDFHYLKVTRTGTGYALLSPERNEGKMDLTARVGWTEEDKNKVPLYFHSMSPIL